MDGTTNEIDFPGATVKGFPTILYFKAGESKVAAEYDGARDLAGFKAFLAKHAKDGAALKGAAAGDDDEDDDEESEEEL